MNDINKNMEESIKEFTKGIELATYNQVLKMKEIMTESHFTIWLNIKTKEHNNKYGIDLSYYDLYEDGNIISCCGQIVDPDVMRCPDCKENI
jgi:hypothetical protein